MFESISIGNEYSQLKASYDSGGIFNHAAYLEIERVSIYNGGFMVMRVAARGSVHVFALGTITQTYYPGAAPPTGHIAWTFSPYGTSSGSDTYADYNDDGAILVCSGSSGTMYQGGTCSLYLASDGSRTDFRMPAVPYYLNLRSWYPGYSTQNQVAYAWPLRTVMADGEVLSYIYTNYGDWNADNGNTPGPTKWNAIESSLGYRVYLPSITPTGGANPGAMYPISNLTAGGGALYAINTSGEYADPATASRSFSSASFSSVRNSAAGGGLTLVNNGIPIATTAPLSPAGFSITKPNGGSIQFLGLNLPPYLSWHGKNGGFSTPQGAFPSLSFQVIRNSTTSYSIAYDNINYTPERYQGTVANPDGSSESFVARFGLLQSQTDGLGRTTNYTYSGQEGFFYGVAGYARLARLSGVTRPDGSGATYNYTHGAVSSASIVPTGGGSALTTTVGLVSSCTVQNYRVCNKPTYIQDPKGNQTDFTYDPAHGGILTETLPADSNGVRPQKRYSYSQFYPKTLNASGQLVNGPPVWRLTRASECSNASPANPASCVGTSSERVTEFSYGSNNLFLTAKTEMLGDSSQSLVTSYTYDYAGNMTSENGPRTDVDDTRYVTYDGLRRKVFEISPDPDGAGPLPRLIVHHVYDADGDEIRTEYGTGQNTNGSDFVVNRFDRSTFDPVTGALLKTESVTP
ncbi:hypothetical protein [Sphingomonas sp. MS122]|uniref:hypothetical protein n=1 Tax=Sphingomonas sp. MS122 TaxID=3412683 RepID=UPI003C2E0489